MKWGIIGFGKIAPAFIEGLLQVEGQHLTAIASISGCEQLVGQRKYPHAKIYCSYTDLVNDPDVEIVYICTTNNLHKENVMAALNAGKHVLCEKPLALCKTDATALFLMAEEKKLFLMEGMWTRFLPSYRRFKDLLANDEIGKINYVNVDFGFYSDWGDERRLMNKALNGGAILDNTDYGVFLCQDVFGSLPKKVNAFARFTHTGVEDMCAVTFQYEDGAMAQLFSGFKQQTRQDALIYGEKGHIKLTEFWHGTVLELSKDRIQYRWEDPLISTGFEFEIREVVSCIKNGKIESKLITHAMSLDVAKLMDLIIDQVKQTI